MKYGIVHHFPGGTKAQYDAVLMAVHVTKDSLPEGQLFHAAASRLAVLRSWRSMTPRRVGSGSATPS